MHDVTIGTLRRRVPATWNELTPAQLLALTPLRYGQYASPIRQRLDVLRLLLGIPPLLFIQFTAVQLVEVGWLAAFVLDEPCTLTAQLLPRLGRWPRRLYGPAAGLSNLLFAEFVFADSFFVAYCQSQDAQWLHKLLAVLYRPARHRGAAARGDRRRPFLDHRLAADARRAARLPRAVQQALYTWYAGCRHALEQRYPLVFTAGDGGKGHPDGWGYVWREVSGGPFGDFDATGRQHAHLVLAKMQDDLQRAADLKAQEPTA